MMKSALIQTTSGFELFLKFIERKVLTKLFVFTFLSLPKFFLNLISGEPILGFFEKSNMRILSS